MLFTVAIIHASVKEVSLLTEVAHDVMADAEMVHMVDEGLPRLVGESGEITEPVTRRVCSYAINAEETGAGAVVLAGSCIGFAIDAVCAAVRVPAVRLDGAMADAAVDFGASIGVLASTPDTLEPTLAFLRERADAHGKDAVFESRLCEDAAPALENDDLEAYDYIVTNEAGRLAENDVIVLADIMMHRVVHAAGERFGIPVLASPRQGFEGLAKQLNYFRR